MNLSSIQLEAFAKLAKVKTFSGAAKELHITQSALSQRILNLEEELGSTLFIRESSGLRLTELGQKLLRYCQVKDGLEHEFLENLNDERKDFVGGILRLGGFSTVMRSVALPILSKVFKENTKVQGEFFVREIRELPELLASGEAEFIFLSYPHPKQNIESILLGYEENVLVQPKNKKFADAYLDNDKEDTTTEDFFKLQKKRPEKWRRIYLDEIYTIIDGVLNGVGRAVIPKHLATKFTGLEIVSGLTPLKIPVYLCYYKQPFYTSLQKLVIEEIGKNASSYLD